MSSAAPSQPVASDGPDPGPRVSQVGHWTLHEYRSVQSTNLVAAGLPAWSAVRAEVQTGGRGRFERAWVSDAGGVWLSAVVPVAPDSPVRRILPLAAGLAVCDALSALAPLSLRLRWPNDLLVGQRKLAGLLIDQFSPGLAVVGVGVNVANRPEGQNPELSGQVVRLAELVSPCPRVTDVAVRVLALLTAVLGDLERSGPAALLPRINALWRGAHRVRVELDGSETLGRFDAVDASGRLRLETETGQTLFLEPHQVRLLRELEPTDS